VNGRCKEEIGKFGEVFLLPFSLLVSSGVLLPVALQITTKPPPAEGSAHAANLQAMAVAKAANDSPGWKTN
jgi:hypothetical protein